jgi:predicted RNA binding protein YcfA (HicA-like mRNA interferase family)
MRRQQAEPGVAVEQVGGARQGARRPPGIVVGEGDVGRLDVPHADGAGGTAAVDAEGQDGHVGEVGVEEFRRAVDGAVVHDDGRRLGEGAEMVEGRGESGEAVTRGDDHRDGGVGAIHRSHMSRGRRRCGWVQAGDEGAGLCLGSHCMKVRDVIKRLEQDGWFPIPARGGHRQYKHPTKHGRVTVPGKLNEDVPPGTLKSIWRQAQLPPVR